MEDSNGIDYRPLHRKLVVARKEYICDGCGKPIKAGTRYLSHAMIYDGRFQFQREHQLNCWPAEY